MARQLPYQVRTPEQEAEVWQIVKKLQEAQKVAAAALDQTIDLQVELWHMQGRSQDDITMIGDRKSNNIHRVERLTSITGLDRFRKWAGV